MVNIKLLTIALTSALGVGGVTAAATQWHRFDGPTFDALQAGGNHGGGNHGNGNHGDGNSGDRNSRDGNSGGGNHFSIGSCGD
ncbi:MAG: hypothetical protein Q7J25_00850 [Vicinamibacterales bacterium]|nr:hypothetical protein [Vicinamibacterales bacterium]